MVDSAGDHAPNSAADRELVLPAVGQPLELRSHTPQQPARGHVRVRLAASAINPSDRMFLTGRYGVKPAPPCVPGFEGVGTVEACGGGLIARVMKDRRVAVAVEQGGTWASTVCVPAGRVFPVGSPETLPDEQAATFFVNPATAWVMTREVLRIGAGQWLLLTAGASALARMIVRLGRREGFKTCVVVRRDEQAATMTELGADAAIVFDAASDEPADLAEAVRSRCGAVPFALDPVGGPLAAAALGALAPEGRLLVYGSLSEEPIPVAPRPLIFNRHRIEGFALGDWLAGKSLAAKGRLFLRLRSLVAEGTLATDRVKWFELDDHAAALDPASTASGEKGVFRLAAAGPR